jgi:enoyl-CoA hydratase
MPAACPTIRKEKRMTYELIVAETRGRVGLITLNRPKAMNALNDQVVDAIGAALDGFEADDDIGAIVITGSEKAFAAGADIGAMAQFSYMDAYKGDYITRNWERVKTCRKPVIASVSGYALGGGCELAMMCDIIIAADTAKFGQPEIKLGILPGAGGTQRLPRAVGKAKAMDLCLTARMMDAAEAERVGLVARVVPADRVLDEALAAAATIASFSLPVAMMIKESVNRAFESSLNEGLLYERRVFHSAFGLDDQKEGMSAFVEKRKANFQHR